MGVIRLLGLQGLVRIHGAQGWIGLYILERASGFISRGHRLTV